MSYCDGLLIYLINLINRLQLEENSAVRLVTPSLPPSPAPVGWLEGGTLHRSPIPRRLHWLAVRFRSIFKILLLTYKALSGLVLLRPWNMALFIICKTLKKEGHAFRNIGKNIYIFPTVKSALHFLSYTFTYCWLESFIRIRYFFFVRWSLLQK